METEALCALVNEAIQADRAVTPPDAARRVNWGYPPVLMDASNLVPGPLPDWATGALHDMRMTLRRPAVPSHVWVSWLGAMGVYVGVLVFAALSVVADGLPGWTLAVLGIPAIVAAIVAVIRVWSVQNVQADPGGLTFIQRLPPITLRKRYIPMADVFGVSSCSDTLLFYLGDEVLQQPCNQHAEEVEAVAAHLDRMLARAPAPEQPEPPDELRRIMGERHAPTKVLT